MKKSILLWAVLASVALFFTGCLTCEKKVYTFEIKSDNSGRLIIKYINIMSIKDDSVDVSEEDFQSLQNDYLNGEELQNSFPDATVVNRRLFKENGVLCGEVIYDFPDLRAAKLFKYKGQGPFMYCLGCNSLDAEYFNESNGEYGNENMPVVFWDEGTKKLTLTTDVTTPDETTVSLLDNYLEYQKNH